MKLQNLRIFSFRCALAIGLGSLIAIAISQSFTFGNGNPLSDLPSVFGWLVIYGIFLIPFIILIIGVSLLACRILGTGITSAVAIILSVAMIVSSAMDSMPQARFRRLVWKEAPASLRIYEHQAGYSFSDGTSYSFLIGADAQMVDSLRDVLGLGNRLNWSPYLEVAFPDRAFPKDTEFYRGGRFELAYMPSEKKVFVVRDPALDQIYGADKKAAN